MDCKISSELMMKYIDGDASPDEEKLLFQHLEVCRCCSLEFQALKDTISLLDTVDAEDAPEDLEDRVVAHITMIKEKKAHIRSFGITAALVAAAWVGFSLIMLYTPFAEVLAGCFNAFMDLLSTALSSIGAVLSAIVIYLAKILTLGRALDVAVTAIINSYGIILAALVISMAFILKIYGYMFKGVRRY